MSRPHDNNDARILVRKYGGSSLASVDRIRTVARDIATARRAGYQVVVVVSAMGKTTDELNELALQVSAAPPRREMDMLLSVGERITMSLLAMALADEGCPAISYTGSQCGIITDGSHTDARIIEVRGDRVRESLSRGQTVVVAGFQGVSLDREITTLGRGGSDTTAVALAAALGAERCEILKDVPGVLSADPNQVSCPSLYERLSWDELRRIATTGCGVVHIRAVEYAAAHGVPLLVGSSFEAGPGTLVEGIRSEPAAPCADAAGSSARPGRYRPLVLHVAEGIARLRVRIGDPRTADEELPQLTNRLDTTGILTEWLEAGTVFRWEVLAPAAILEPVRAGFEQMARRRPEAGIELEMERDLTCFSLAGSRPDSWLEVRRQVADVLAAQGVTGARLRADGSALRILVSGEVPADLATRIHSELLPA